MVNEDVLLMKKENYWVILMSLVYKIRDILKNSLYQNTIYNISAKGVAMVLYMLVDIGIARLVSVSEYGEWSYFYSLISMLFWIAWFGINSSARVYIAKTNGNSQMQNQYLKSALILRIVISAGIVFVYYFLVFLMKAKIMSMETYPNLYMLLLFGGSLVFCSTFSEFFKEINIGMVRFKQILIITFLEYGGYLFWGVGILWLVQNVFLSNYYIVGLLVGYTVALLGVNLYGVHTIKEKIKNSIGINYGYMKEIFKYAIPILVMSFGALITLELDTVMIGSIYEGEQVAIYSIAKKICSKAAHINIAICTATMTEFAVLNKVNIKKKKALFKRLMWINGGITIGIVSVFVCIVPFLIIFFYGEAYKEAYKILCLLLPYFIMNSFSFFMSSLMDYQEKAKLRSIFYIVMLILDIVLNALWIPKYGGRGAAWATSVSIIPYFLCLILGTVKLFYSFERQT